jgi:hypothetical protein
MSKKKYLCWMTMIMIVCVSACISASEDQIGEIEGNDIAERIEVSSTRTVIANETLPSTSMPTETPANEVVVNPDVELAGHHETGDGRLVVSFPEEWYTTSLRKPGETVNNIAMSNNSSGYTGNSGQILVQIFEPVYVMELFGIADTSVTSLEDIYAAITSGDEPELLENGGEPQFLSLNGRELLRLDFSLPQYDTMMLSLRTTDGYIVQMNAVMAPGEIEQFEDTVMAIASTLDYTAPERELAEGSPAAVVQEHFQIVESGELQDVQTLYCQQDLIAMEILNALIEEGTGFENIEETFETLAGADRALTAPDFSHLFYQTVLLEEEELAIVRISGNVVLTNSEGERDLVPYLNFTLMDTDGWRLIWEGNQWKICTLS